MWNSRLARCLTAGFNCACRRRKRVKTQIAILTSERPHGYEAQNRRFKQPSALRSANGFALTMRASDRHWSCPRKPIRIRPRQPHRAKRSAWPRTTPTPTWRAITRHRSNERDGGEGREYPAPSPGCRVLSPYPRHSPAILRVAQNPNCSLLHTAENTCLGMQPAHSPCFFVRRRSPTAAVPPFPFWVSPRTHGEFVNVCNIEQNLFWPPLSISHESDPYN